jgi:hypothetical protein
MAMMTVRQAGTFLRYLKDREDWRWRAWNAVRGDQDYKDKCRVEAELYANLGADFRKVMAQAEQAGRSELERQDVEDFFRMLEHRLAFLRLEEVRLRDKKRTTIPTPLYLDTEIHTCQDGILICRRVRTALRRLLSLPDPDPAEDLPMNS